MRSKRSDDDAVIIVFANNKGGSSKTATTVNVASEMHLRNKNLRILIVDTDAQGNASRSFGLNPAKLSPNMYDIFMDNGEVDLESCIQKDVRNTNIDIIPSNTLLNFLEFDTIKMFGDSLDILIKGIGSRIEKQGKSFTDLSPDEISEFIPKEANPAYNYFNRLDGKFDEIRKKYDYILFDTPPELKSVTSSVLAISDIVFIPYEPDVYSMDGIVNIVERINAIKEEYNPNLEIGGFIATKFKRNTNLHKDVHLTVSGYANKHNLSWFSTTIPYSIKVGSSTAYNKLPIVLMGKQNPVADAYHELVTEMIDKGLIDIKDGE